MMWKWLSSKLLPEPPAPAPFIPVRSPTTDPAAVSVDDAPAVAAIPAAAVTATTCEEQMLAAYRAGDWETMVALGRKLPAGSPAPIAVYSLLFDAQCHLRSFDDAEATIQDALKHFPDELVLLGKRARLATMTGQYRVAAERWKALQSDYPDIEEFYVMGAFCFQQVEDHEGALTLLDRGTKALPESLDIWLMHLRVLLADQRAEQALASWAEGKSQWADDFRVTLLGAEIRFALRDYREAQSLLTASLAQNQGKVSAEHQTLKDRLDRIEEREMLMNFESLAGRMEGCEFGFVHRSVGAEPLSLLRWANMWPEDLIRALEERFDGVGEPEQTVLKSPHEPGADWTTEDKKFGMAMHTWDYSEDTPDNFDRLFRTVCTRYRFLKRKLIEDLTEGRKIFVFKISYETLDDATLGRLHMALRDYGPATLLYVCQPTDLHPAGTVEWRGPGLMVGYIEKFSFEFGHHGQYTGVSPEAWMPILRKAHQMWINKPEHSA